MASGYITYKGYNAFIEYYHKDSLYLGKILNIQDKIKFHGNNLTELKRNFESSVDEYIQSNKLRIKDNVINGYPDGTFRPHAPITRAEMASIATKMLSLREW